MIRSCLCRAEDISFSNTPTSLQYTIGENALLQCVATGQPAPEVSWRFNRRKISPGNDSKSIFLCQGGEFQLNLSQTLRPNDLNLYSVIKRTKEEATERIKARASVIKTIVTLHWLTRCYDSLLPLHERCYTLCGQKITRDKCRQFRLLWTKRTKVKAAGCNLESSLYNHRVYFTLFTVVSSSMTVSRDVEQITAAVICIELSLVYTCESSYDSIYQCGWQLQCNGVLLRWQPSLTKSWAERLWANKRNPSRFAEQQLAADVILLCPVCHSPRINAVIHWPARSITRWRVPPPRPLTYRPSTDFHHVRILIPGRLN